MLPFLGSVKNKNKVQPLLFTGINKNEMVGDNEIVDGFNLGSKNLPAMSPRLSEETLIEDITTPNGFALFDNKIAYQDGVNFFYDGVVNLEILTDSEKTFALFNSNLIIVPDKKTFDGTTLSVLQGSIYIERGDLDDDGLVALDETKVRTRGYVSVVSGETITFSNTEGYTHDVYEFDKDFNYITITLALTTAKTMGSDTEYVKMVLNGDDVNAVLTINTTKPYPSEGKSPDIDYIVEHYNRLFGIKNKTIYGSAWSDADNWAYFQGLENDSYAFDSKSEGNFVTMHNFQNHLVFFKQNEMFEMYGYNPSEFTLQTIANIGCVSKNALCEHRSILYLVSQDNIYAYSGGMPRKIGDKLNLKDIVSASIVGSDGELFVSMTKDNLTYENYVYSIATGSWLPYTENGVKQFVNYNNKVYYLTFDGKIKLQNSGNEDVEWGFTTKTFNGDTFNKTITSKIKLKMKLKLGSEISLYVKIDNNSWILSDIFTNNSSYEEKDFKTILKPIRDSRFQIRFVCKGFAIIQGEREFYERSDV